METRKVEQRTPDATKGQGSEPVTGVRREVAHGRDKDPDELLDRYRKVRSATEALTKGLEPEDTVVQTMEEVSPTKWHLAHTSWFWECFVLMPHVPEHAPVDGRYHYLFNSYYVQAGERHCRARRGYISRPTLSKVMAYRRHVDEAMERMLSGVEPDERLGELVELGLNHEQQHQELILTDLKHVFSVNPLRPPYRGDGGDDDAFRAEPRSTVAAPPRWIEFEGGLREIGWGGGGFHYDNEAPRHRCFLEPFALSDRLVTNGEYLAFMEDGGYRRPELWMSEGWASREAAGWTEPFYWERRDDEWWTYTLRGMRRVDPREPVCHLSWFEADAFARWTGARLPREEEWEVAAGLLPIEGNLADSARLHPLALEEHPSQDGSGADSFYRTAGLRQMFGDVWEWTASPYVPYPGFRPSEGAVGEYNGKFMCNQFVLRGGSCVTPAGHVRATYRNFFPPNATWQFTGLRLARDLSSETSFR